MKIQITPFSHYKELTLFYNLWLNSHIIAKDNLSQFIIIPAFLFYVTLETIFNYDS